MSEAEWVCKFCSKASAAREITAEMIEAGEEILFRFDPDYSNSESYVRKIFFAMLDAQESHNAA